MLPSGHYNVTISDELFFNRKHQNEIINYHDFLFIFEFARFILLCFPFIMETYI